MLGKTRLYVVILLILLGLGIALWPVYAATVTQERFFPALEKILSPDNRKLGEQVVGFLIYGSSIVGSLLVGLAYSLKSKAEKQTRNLRTLAIIFIVFLFSQTLLYFTSFMSWEI